VASPDLDPNESRLSRIKFYIEKRLPIVQRAGNPKLLLSYIITIILELNREATQYHYVHWNEDQEIRRKLRQDLLHVLGQALVSIPAIDDVQQTAYALSLLSVSISICRHIVTLTYPLTLHCSENVSTMPLNKRQMVYHPIFHEIYFQKHPSDFPKMDSCYKVILDLCDEMLYTIAPKVSQGWTGDEFVPEYLLSTFNNMIEIIYNELTIVAIKGEYDSELWTRRRDTIQLVMMYAENVTSTLLSTQVANEKSYLFECGMTNFSGQRVYANDIKQAYRSSGFQLMFPKDIVAYLPPETEIFQTLNTSLANPYLWGFIDNLSINSYVVSPKFAFINGTDVTVHDLPKEKEIHLSYGRSPFQESNVWENLKDQISSKPKIVDATSFGTSQPHNNELVHLPTELNYTSTLLKPKSHLSSTLRRMRKINEGTVGFQLVITVYEVMRDFPHSNMGSASLYIGVGYIPHKYKFDQMLTVVLEDFGWSDPADAVWTSSFNWMER